MKSLDEDKSGIDRGGQMYGDRSIIILTSEETDPHQTSHIVQQSISISLSVCVCVQVGGLLKHVEIFIQCRVSVTHCFGAIEQVVV